MKLKNIVLSIAGITGTVLVGMLFKKGLPSNTAKIIQEAVVEPEKITKECPYQS